jgi:hypothetical protein
MESKTLGPINSLLNFLWNLIIGKISFPKCYNGTKLRMENDKVFEVFRHVTVGSKEHCPVGQSIFVVQFKLKNMSIKVSFRQACVT